MENMNRVNMIKTGVINEKQLNWIDLKSASVAYNLRFSAYTQNIRTVFMVLLLTTAVSASENQTKPVKSGQNITLTCRAPNNNTIAVKWRRADLGEEYVYLNRGGQPQPQKQHSSFTNRVDLQDREMKDGDVSLILKDVTVNDTGTYECLVFVEETDSMKSVDNITLSVDPPGPPEDGFVGLEVFLPVFLLFLFLVFLVVILCRPWKKEKCPFLTNDSELPY